MEAFKWLHRDDCADEALPALPDVEENGENGREENRFCAFRDMKSELKYLESDPDLDCPGH